MKMAKLTIGQKAYRVLKFLMGLKQPVAIEVLKARGFTQNDLEDGWRWLRVLARSRLEGASPIIAEDHLGEIHTFENEWYPVARLTLDRHHPAGAEYLFAKLPQTGGTDVVVSVQLFLERLTALASGQSPLGEEGVKARALLAQRGLTPQVAAEAQALLDQIGALNEGAPPPSVDETAEAEQALWAWYLEWGGIARHSITDRRLLRSLGFLKPTRGGKNAEDEFGDLGVGDAPAAGALPGVAPMPQLTQGAVVRTGGA
jgi:hypothetical protein